MIRMAQIAAGDANEEMDLVYVARSAASPGSRFSTSHFVQAVHQGSIFSDNMILVSLVA